MNLSYNIIKISLLYKIITYIYTKSSYILLNNHIIFDLLIGPMPKILFEKIVK